MIELNKIYNENCLDTMARMPDNFVDLVVTSPPYDNLRDYKGYDFDFESIAKELFRVIKVGGVVVWVVGDATINGSETGTSFRQALYFMQCGFNLHDTMIYKSSKPPLTHNRYEQEFEYMFVFSSGRPKTYNLIKTKSVYCGARSDRPKSEKGSAVDGRAIRSREETNYRFVNSLKIRGNVWEFLTGGGLSSSDYIAFEHPAVFPEQLASDHIYSWSNEGDLIYDPFMGSGTTAKMAHIRKRNWIGSEISSEYCDIANKRLSAYINQIELI